MCLEFKPTEEQLKKSKRGQSSQSFGDWMIENLGEDAIEKYWAKCNTISPFDVGIGSKFTICINCIETNYHISFTTTPKQFTKSHKCPYCNHRRFHPMDSFAHHGIKLYGDDFLEKYWSDDNDTSPYEIPYYSKETVLLKCQKIEYHNFYPTTPNYFFQGVGCSYCGNLKTHPKDSLGEWMINNLGENSIEEYWSDENEVSPWDIRVFSGKKIIVNNKDYIGQLTKESNTNKFISEIEAIMYGSKKIKVSFAQWGIEKFGDNFLERYWHEDNIHDPWKIGTSSDKIVLIKCQINSHHISKVSAKNFTKTPKCRHCPKKPTIRYSFFDWFNDNFPNEDIEFYWSPDNEVSPKDVPYRDKENWFKFTCQNPMCKCEYSMLPNRFFHGRRCTECKPVGWRSDSISLAEWGTENIGENFIEDYWGTNNSKTPHQYTSSTNNTVWIKCQEVDYHGEYLAIIGNFTSNGARCPYCSNAKVHIKDSLYTHLVENGKLSLWSEMNIKSCEEVHIQSSSFKYHWKCPDGVHEDFTRSADVAFDCDYRCPHCVSERTESLLQEKVRLYITESLKYPVSHEYQTEIICKNPQTKHNLPYDNEIITNQFKLIVEVHGMQHYKVSHFARGEANRKSITPEDELKYLQWKDDYKKNFALSQGYHYLEIPYWADNKDNEWKRMIDNKIKEIIHKEELI